MSNQADFDWIVQSCTNDRLAQDLERIADDIRFFGQAQRTAILREAARRLAA
jgi:hypothetical protein